MVPFEQPADSDGTYVSWKEVTLNSVLLFAPKEFLKDHGTNFGPKDAIRGDVGVLSGPLAGKIYKNAVVTQAQMVDAVKARLGKMVLGRLGERQPKNPGYKPYWTLEKFQSGDDQLAERFVAKFPEFGQEETNKWGNEPTAPPVTNPNFPVSQTSEDIPF